MRLAAYIIWRAQWRHSHSQDETKCRIFLNTKLSTGVFILCLFLLNAVQCFSMDRFILQGCHNPVRNSQYHDTFPLILNCLHAVIIQELHHTGIVQFIHFFLNSSLESLLYLDIKQWLSNHCPLCGVWWWFYNTPANLEAITTWKLINIVGLTYSLIHNCITVCNYLYLQWLQNRFIKQ